MTADPKKDHDVQCDDVSDLVSVADFKRKCAELYEDVRACHVTQDGDHVTGVADVCNTASLLPPGGLDPYLKGKKSNILKKTKLQCLNYIDAQRAYFERKGLTVHGLASKPFTSSLPMRVGGGDTLSPDGDASSGSGGVPVTVSQGEVVISVFAYHPIKKRRDALILVLGCQPLTELRDKIPCFRDFIVDEDYSEDPSKFNHHSLITGVPPSRSKSAFFFINNTFYNDCRHPDSLNLSAPIIKWTREVDIDKSPRLDRFYTADMATTRLDQLQMRLGYPYLYCHHQTCQHLIIFSDLRLLHPTDSQMLSDYPAIHLLHFGRRRLCYVCNIFSPLWVTLEDEMAPESPCLFCNDCFKKLHYSSDDKKMCRFKAYPYNPTMLF